MQRKLLFITPTLLSQFTLLFLLFAIFCPTLYAQQNKPVQGKPASWVTIKNIIYTKDNLDKDASDGYIDVWLEKQISLATQTRYERFCKKILSETGVQNSSTITISFDPAYQSLILHSIDIIRDGQRINKLSLSKIKTLHQEEDLKDFIYNGILDAVLILDDVRKGDFIEYSYSVKGFNPVFNAKYADDLETQFSVPVYGIFYRLLLPEARTITIKNFNETTQPTITKQNGISIYEWHKSDVARLQTQDHMPSWYNPFGHIAISEFKNWSEVNNWAMSLFPSRQKPGLSLQNKIKEILSTDSLPSKRLTKALRFVQDDIRYMGIEMGEHSHRPALPERVFAQRFGDCKEKSYLLCTILNALQIEACPVLINTNVKKSLFELLPSPLNFNHMVVRAKLDGSYYFYDPTISFQRGEIKDIFFPDYQAGLIVNDSTQALTAIPFRPISYQHIDEYFKVENMNGAGSLIVTTQFKGDEADETRRFYHNESNAEILNDNKKFYAKYYNDIVADSLVSTDDENTGIFTTKEYYTIPLFWTIEEKIKKFRFNAFAIDNIIVSAKDKKRNMPIRLPYPANYKEEITVVLPEEWNVEESESHFKNDGVTFDSHFYNEYNQVHLVANYESRKDFVSIEEAPEYFKNINKYYDSNAYYLSLGDETAHLTKKTQNDTFQYIIGFAILIGAILLIIFFRNRS